MPRLTRHLSPPYRKQAGLSRSPDILRQHSRPAKLSLATVGSVSSWFPRARGIITSGLVKVTSNVRFTLRPLACQVGRTGPICGAGGALCPGSCGVGTAQRSLQESAQCERRPRPANAGQRPPLTRANQAARISRTSAPRAGGIRPTATRPCPDPRCRCHQSRRRIRE